MRPNETVSENRRSPTRRLGPSCLESPPSVCRRATRKRSEARGEGRRRADFPPSPLPLSVIPRRRKPRMRGFQTGPAAGSTVESTPIRTCATSTGNLNWLAVSLSNHGPGLGMRGSAEGRRPSAGGEECPPQPDGRVSGKSCARQRIGYAKVTILGDCGLGSVR